MASGVSEYITVIESVPVFLPIIPRRGLAGHMVYILRLHILGDARVTDLMKPIDRSNSNPE